VDNQRVEVQRMLREDQRFLGIVKESLKTVKEPRKMLKFLKILLMPICSNKKDHPKLLSKDLKIFLKNLKKLQLFKVEKSQTLKKVSLLLNEM